MVQLQLAVGIFLTCCALLSSAALFYHSRGPDREVQLPLNNDSVSGLDGGSKTDDPFDVTTPEDVLDGYAIAEEDFWVRMRLRKLFLATVLGVLVVVQTIAFGWTVAADEDAVTILAAIFYGVYALHNFILSVAFVGYSDHFWHPRVTVHLAILSTSAVLFMSAISILPGALSQEPAQQITWFISLGLWFVAFWLSSRTNRGPPLHFPPERVYATKTLESKTNFAEENVCGIANASPWGVIMFSYTTCVVMLGYAAESLEIADLPIVPGNMRATALFARMREAAQRFRLRKATPGSGWQLAYRILRVNTRLLVTQVALVVVTAVFYYVPAYFLRQLIAYLESDPDRVDTRWGWVYCAGLFAFNAITYLLTGQLWSLSTTNLQVSIKVQLNTLLYAKTLVRKDLASTAVATSVPGTDKDKQKQKKDGASSEKGDDGDFSSKAQIMTLMTTDVDRVSEFAWHNFSLIDSPIEIIIGTIFLYNLLGVSCFIGLAVTCLFLPMNHYASKVVVVAQDNLMKARDERVALMNEVLGAIRMLKFMAWERSFEKRVLAIRDKELKYQRLNYIIETLFNSIWSASPLLVTLVSFWHYTVIRGNTLTPSVAFTSIAVFEELKFALNALPETFINMLQGFVSLRRIERYLNTAEVGSVDPLDDSPRAIIIQSATISWPQDRSGTGSSASSAVSTPRRKFSLVDVSLDFPLGELSLICGKLGSGKTLLLLALLGETDLLAGRIECPRSPPNIIASFTSVIPSPKEWVVQGVCAYVPQVAWLQNATIRENILFNLPYVEERYQKTLEACALISDMKILEDGDQSEIGERGVNLSGGQKARVSLARAVYSRASVLLLDDVLSAVDAHTAHHLYHECLKGELMRGRTVILVSHHVQLCAAGSSYIVSLNNGRVAYSGHSKGFKESGVMAGLLQSEQIGESKEDTVEGKPIEESDVKPSSSSASITSPFDDTETAAISETDSTLAAVSDAGSKAAEKKAPRKLVEEEKRAVGRIGQDIWKTYFGAIGGKFYWSLFGFFFLLGALSPVVERGWLSHWTDLTSRHLDEKGPLYYVGAYALITFIGLIITTLRWLVLYEGSIHASTVLYKKLLETVLFAQIRFHDTVSRGRLLNRFGKDFEGIDSSLADNFGRSFMYFLNVVTTLVAVTVVGGPLFLVAAFLLGLLYFKDARLYGRCSRDMRRLDSVSRSPLYSIYGETIAGVPVLRAYGASSKFLRDMLRCVDNNTNPYYWLWGVNRWMSNRFNLLSSTVVGVTGVIAILNPSISASLAGFALAFASTITGDILFMVRRFVGLEQSMVAVERVKEYSELEREGSEFVEPRPSIEWPSHGAIECESLSIRYAPELPDVLHNLNFKIDPGAKIGVIGRTGSGKSTLALSLFRFVEPTEGRILVDGVDIAKIGLTDLRSKLTIIPQDPTILSGTLRSTLDVFDEYQDAELYEALRRVHLIPSRHEEDIVESEEENENVFRDLDSPVSEGGDNFSTGEKQLLCMARAILKRSRILVMDEATASVDYATDELIGKTIRQEFASSTLVTIAHRLRTIIDYDRVMVLDQGHITEFDRPATLLADSSTRFYGLCKATGKDEFAVLKKMAGVQ